MVVPSINSKILAVSLFALSGLGTSFFFSGGYDISYAPTLIFLSIALWLSWDKGQTLSIPTHTFLYGLFALYTGLSVFWSGAPYISLVSFLVICALPITYILTRHILNTHKHLSPILVVIGIGTLLSLYGAIDMVTSNKSRLTSSFSNPNTCSALIVLCLIPSTMFFVKATEQLQKILWGLITLLFISILILTGSRSGLLSGICAITLLFTLISHPKKKRYIAYIIGGYAFFALFALFQDMRFFTRILETFSNAYNDSTQGRLTIWSGSWELAKDHFLYGTGIGTFFLNYPSYRMHFDPSAGQWAHWDGLQILGEIGIFGTSLWYSFWATLTYSLYKNRKTLSDMAIIGGVGCLVILIQGHITYLYLILPILCVMGVYLACYDHGLKEKPIDLKRKPILIAILCILLVSAQSAWSMWASQQRDANINAIEIWGTPFFYEHQLTLARQANKDAIELVKDRCTPCAHPYLIEGILYLQNGEKVKAKASFWEALHKNPSDQMVRTYLVRSFVTSGQLTEGALIAKQGFQYPIEKGYKDYFNTIILNHEQTKVAP